MPTRDPEIASSNSGPVLSNEEIAARRRFFGEQAVDPANGAVRRDRVILSWAGVATFAAAINGHVVLLDAYVPQVTHPGYVPTTWQELAALRPEAIFLGHSHFDHLGHAGPIAAATGAAVVGTKEHCAEAQETAPEGAQLSCASPLERATPFGEVVSLDDLLPGVAISMIRHRHSPGLSPESVSDLSLVSAEPGDRRCTGHLEPETYLEHLALNSDEATWELRTGLGDLAQGGGDGGVVLYQFRVGGFSLAYNDTSAAFREAPPELKAGLRALPDTDVLLGSIASLNSTARCMRDAREYAEALRARMFVPNHHDPFTIQPASDPAGIDGAELALELARVPPDRRPCLRYISDPEDYVRPERLTFDVADEDPCQAGGQRLVSERERRRLTLRVAVRGRTLRATVRGSGVVRARAALLRGRRVVARRYLGGCRGGACHVRFSRLRAGGYRLRVTAATRDGIVLRASRAVRVR